MHQYLSNRTLWIIINDLYNTYCKDEKLEVVKKNDLLKKLKYISNIYDKRMECRIKERVLLIECIKKIKYNKIEQKVVDEKNRNIGNKLHKKQKSKNSRRI